MKHTPGPWKVVQYSMGAEIYAQTPLKNGNRDGYQLLIGTIGSARHDDPQGNANAALISASPAMYSLLRQLYTELSNGMQATEEQLDRINSVLNTAEGK